MAFPDPYRLSLMALGAILLLSIPASADPGNQREGRFLYCGDDDWDWASPLGAKEPSKLSTYGKMPWSALDWIEEGLDEVRGVLIGTAPVVGEQMVINELSDLRGDKATYRNEAPGKESIAKILAATPPPNVVLLMRHSNRDEAARLCEDDIVQLTSFVTNGGRLLVLDDWAMYIPILDAAVARTLEAAPEKQPLDPGTVEEVVRLVEQLGAEEFRTREKASEELLKLGRDGIELGQKLADKNHPNDPEIKDRLAKLHHHVDPPEARLDNDQHRATTRRMRAAAAKLHTAGVPCQTPNALVDREGTPLQCLKLVFPAN